MRRGASVNTKHAIAFSGAASGGRPRYGEGHPRSALTPIKTRRRRRNSIDPAHKGCVVKYLRQGPVVTTALFTSGVLVAGYAGLRRGGLVPGGDPGSA
jgi:hypothetical protein